jgi:hypothetical protein
MSVKLSKQKETPMRKPFVPRSAVALVAALVLAFIPAMRAAEPAAKTEGPAKSESPAKSEPSSKFMPFRGKVTAVDKTAMTISLAGKEKPRIFVVTSETKFFKDNKPATLADLTVGEEVGGRARLAANGKQEIMTLRIGAKLEGQEKTESVAKPKTAEKKPTDK